MEWLSRQFNSRLDDALNSGAFDFIILGAGFFGAYTACQLIEQSYPRKPRILLIEQGHFGLPHHYTTYPYLTKADLAAVNGSWQGARVYYESKDLVREERGHRVYNVVGGDSHFWDLCVPRPSLEDMSKWPSGMAETLEENLIEAEQQLGVRSQPGYWRGALQDRMIERVSQVTSQWGSVQYVSGAPMAIQTVSPCSGQLSRGPYSPINNLLEHLSRDARQDIHLVSGCKVKQLMMTGKYVTQIKVMDENRNQIRMIDVPSRTQVISAMGCRASTALFLNSFDRNHRCFNHIGRNLNSHLRSVFHLQIRRELLGMAQTDFRHNAGIVVQGKDYLFQIYACPGRAASGMVGMHHPVGTPVSEQNSRWITLTLVAQTTFSGHRNRLVLESEKSLTGATPMARYYVGQKEMDCWQNNDRLAVRLLGMLTGNKAPEGSVYWRHGEQWLAEAPKTTGLVRLSVGSSVHECGTLSIANDSNHGILDIWGQCHSIYNLSCLDTAAVPWMGAGSPVLPAMAWGRLASQQIVHQWQATPAHRPAAINGRIFS
ncbi:GMC oxidoreductase [Gynuella sp.]|uniref:GMC oxidoreductase n=1 Tax=Gynuella sp. TaxID=2969146 RepID=UPI003D1405E3